MTTGIIENKTFGKVFELAVVALGVVLNAIGVGVFILPNNFLCGGATGFGRFISYFTNIPVSYSVAIITGILFLMGLIFLGVKFAATIVLGTIVYPLALNIIERIPGITSVTDDKMLSAAFGALFIGVGVGMVVRMGGSTGGSDVIAVLLNKKKGLNTAAVLNAVDFTALIVQCIFASKEDVLYGILIIMAYSTIVNKVLIMGSNDAQFIVVSKKWKEINESLHSKASVGTTLLHGETGYEGNTQEVIVCTAQKRALKKVKDVILEEDPLAFITVLPASDVSGRGFSISRNYQIDNK